MGKQVDMQQTTIPMHRDTLDGGFLSPQGQSTVRPQMESIVVNTVYVVKCGVGPLAATIRLSLNCCSCRTPSSVTNMSPMQRRRHTNFLRIQTRCISAAGALQHFPLP